jgi:hypothetical protein
VTTATEHGFQGEFPGAFNWTMQLGLARMAVLQTPLPGHQVNRGFIKMPIYKFTIESHGEVCLALQGRAGVHAGNLVHTITSKITNPHDIVQKFQVYLRVSRYCNMFARLDLSSRSSIRQTVSKIDHTSYMVHVTTPVPH